MVKLLRTLSQKEHIMSVKTVNDQDFAGEVLLTTSEIVVVKFGASCGYFMAYMGGLQ